MDDHPRVVIRPAPLRRRSRRRTALAAPPTTASPRSAALLLGWLLAGGGGAVLAVLLALPSSRGAGVVGQQVVVAVGALVAGAVVLRRRELSRWGVNAALGLSHAVLAVFVLTAQDPQLGAAFASGCTVLALVVVATCSWVQTLPHLAVMVALLLARQLLGDDPAWAAFAIEVVLLVIACAFAGFMVRAAAVAEVDALTGLPNRRGAERRLDEMVVLAADAVASPVHSAAVIDLDHFKAVNDTHGHAAGDELLRDVAHALHWAVSSSLGRGSDALVARWGGDEFVIAAAVEPQRLATALDAARALLPRGASCSAGVAAVLPGDTPSRVLSRADLALYEVKRSARGRTEVAVTTTAVVG